MSGGCEMTQVDYLFRSIQLGNMTLPNRVVMTTVKLGYSDQRGVVTDRHIAFYVRRAVGKAGLITSEPMHIAQNGRELPTQLGFYDDFLISGMQRLTDAVHEAGGRIMAHINHAGRAVNPKLVPDGERVSSSNVLCPANQVTPRPLTRTEITEVVSAFGQAARRVVEAGFDAIEIPFSHGYLIHQFLSPHTNMRTDDYGGSLEKQLRFGLEVIEAVRNQVGLGFPIVVRMNVTDYVDGGLVIEDAIEIARALQSWGVHALSITSGTMCESVPFCLYPSGTPKANLLPMAARIREEVNLPVIVAGRIRTPSLAREALESGQADLIGLGRPFLADPDWVLKTESGDEDAILLCAACHQGCLAQLRVGAGTSCVFNPLTGCEADVQIKATPQPRNVMVVGGGPAGLEAAAMSAQRGHVVTLYEQESHLGGQFCLAAKAPHKEEFEDVIRYLGLVAERAGVNLRMDTRVTPEMVIADQPDVLILATGGLPLTINFPGLEDTRWMLASDLLDGGVSVETPSAFVIGGGLVGLETADFLAEGGVQVTLVEMLDQVGGDMDPLAKMMLMKELLKNDVKIHTGCKVLRFTKNTSVVQHHGDEEEFPVETVVIAIGVRSNRELAEALAESDLETYIIGDAVEPRKALDAIHEGFEIGIKV